VKKYHKRVKNLLKTFNKHSNDYEIEYRIHATRRMFQRFIHEDDVEAILKKGTVIEQYDDDLPFPSFLINGTGSDNAPLHVVAALNIDESKIVIITVYKPDPLKWNKQFSRRNK